MPKGGKQPGAGRPLGRKNNRTLKQEAMWQAFVETFEPELKKVVKELIKKAKGEGKADVSAAKELFERTMGKVPEQHDFTSGGEPLPLIKVDALRPHNSDNQDSPTPEKVEDSFGGNGSEQNSQHLNFVDQLRPVGSVNPNPDDDSLGELPSPEPGSDEGILGHPQEPPLLQGQ